jgi:class 3 adenylate cyclase/DNA-binding beta-propeller fold protein YncE
MIVRCRGAAREQPVLDSIDLVAYTCPEALRRKDMQEAERERGTTELPTGTVTFLFTEIDSSTELLKQLGEGDAASLAEHHRILRKAVAEQGGREIDSQGESFLFAFGRANAAVGAAVLAQRALLEHAWPEGAEVRVRMGIHTDEPIVGDDRIGVHRAAWIGAVAHGGQVLLSNATRELLEDGLAGVSIRDLGSYRLEDLDRFERLFQVEVAGLRSDFPPLQAERVAEPRPISQTEVQIGAEFLGYRIEEQIGHGGMGIVYRAYDLRLKRTVALKLVTPELALDERFRERFARETELAISLEHPNVVPIHDAGDVAGRLYLAMRLVAGTDLRKLLRAEGALEPSRALAICRQVANALDAAHAKGLVHRDVKPSNILLDEAEHVYLADFGLTRRLEEKGALAGEGRSVGTPAYLAPEQIEGERVDGRADVYSLGCVLYECLAGEAPFVHGSRLAVAWAHLEEEPPSASERGSDLPEAIDAVLRGAMAKSPDERYRSCAALIEAAEAALGIRSRSRGRRRLVVAALAAATIAAAAAVATAILLGGGDAAPTVVSDSLVKIDLDSGKIVDVVPVGRNPGEIEIVGPYVFAASEGDGTLTRVDTRTGAVVNSGKFDATAGLAAEGAKRVWVASIGRRQVTAVDAALPLLDPADPPSSPRVTLPRVARGTSLTVGGGSLWIAASTAEGGVLERWRLHPLGRQRAYRLGLYDYGVSVTFGYGAAWIALGAPANALLRVDARTGRTRRIPVGRFPDAVAVGFGSVWVAQKEDDTVRRIDPVTGRTRRVIAVGHLPFEVAVGQGSVWVTSECAGTVSRIDPASNRVVGTIELGYHPQWLTVGDGFAWVDVGKTVYFGSCP